MSYPNFGLCCVIPMTLLAWKKLINGELTESEVSLEYLFNANTTTDGLIGLHVYHMDKTELWSREYKRMGEVVLEDLNVIVSSLVWSQRGHTSTGPRPVIVAGFSGSTVTEAGFRLFKTLYGCNEVAGGGEKEFIVGNQDGSRKMVVNEARYLEAIVNNDFVLFGQVRLVRDSEITYFQKRKDKNNNNK